MMELQVRDSESVSVHCVSCGLDMIKVMKESGNWLQRVAIAINLMNIFLVVGKTPHKQGLAQ